jgi:hypothetical protein
MFNVRSCFFIFLIVQAVLINTDASIKKDSGKNNYFVIREMYNQWESALYGVRNYHRRNLYYLLIDLIGKDIETDNDYRISIPDILEKDYYNSDLYNNKWLHIHGPADISNIKEFKEKGNEYIKEIERNKYLFSLSGRIKKFRIIQTCTGRTVHLYLESVKLRRDF